MSRLLRLSLVSTTRWVVLFLSLTVLFVLGVDLLFQDEAFRKSYAWLAYWVPLSKLDRTPFLVLGASCCLLPIFYATAAIIEGRLSRGLVGRGRDGADICLAPEAIERAITREVRDEVVEVLKVTRCDAVQSAKGPHITLTIVTSDRRPVPEVQKAVREVVTQVLERTIGFASGSVIRVKVREIAVAGKTKGARRRPTEKAEANA